MILNIDCRIFIFFFPSWGLVPNVGTIPTTSSVGVCSERTSAVKPQLAEFNGHFATYSRCSKERHPIIAEHQGGIASPPRREGFFELTTRGGEATMRRCIEDPRHVAYR